MRWLGSLLGGRLRRRGKQFVRRRPRPAAAEPYLNIAASLHAQGRSTRRPLPTAACCGMDPCHFDSLMGLGNALLDRRDFAGAKTEFLRRSPWMVAAPSPGGISARPSTIRTGRRKRLTRTDTPSNWKRPTAGMSVLFLVLPPVFATPGGLRKRSRCWSRTCSVFRAPKRSCSTRQMLLAVGRLKEGWHHAEFRWMTRIFCAASRFAGPFGAGRTCAARRSCSGRSRVLATRSSSCATPRPSRRWGRPCICCTGGLAGLVRGVAGIDRVYLSGPTGPHPVRLLHLLLSVPHVFGADRIDSRPRRLIWSWIPRGRALGMAARPHVGEFESDWSGRATR